MRIKKNKKEVLSIVKACGRHGIRSGNISDQTRWKPRTVCNALRDLLSEGLIKRIPDLADMRGSVYYYGVE